MNLAQSLATGIQALGLTIDAQAQAAMLQYLGLLEKWNKAYNLTAVRDPQKMLTHHLLDSLAIMPHVKGPYILDVGSGAGLPGIPLALARPQWHLTLLDANQKKTIFLRQVAIELKMPQVTVVCDRTESWRSPIQFQTIVSRAYSDLSDFVKGAGRLCAPEGLMLAMKGVYPEGELQQLQLQALPFLVRETVALTVPQLVADRHAVLLEPV